MISRLLACQVARLLATGPTYLVTTRPATTRPSKDKCPKTANKHWDQYKDPTTGVAFFDSFVKACLRQLAEDAARVRSH